MTLPLVYSPDAPSFSFADHDVSSTAWVLAASDLGIRVTAPFVQRDRFGDTIEFIAHVRDFGSSRGTLVWYMPEPIPTRRMVNDTAFFSVLNPALYYDYDRDRFVTLLTQWGWSGIGTPPDWYREP